MQAVILAGGLGTRLGELTKATPKPMVNVAGKPYLEHQILILAQQGIRDLVLLTGYLGEQIQDYFGNGEKCGVSIRYSQESSPQGTGGALRDGGSFLDDSFLLIYGDSYLPIDYTAVLGDLNSAPDIVGVAVVYDNSQSTNVVNNIAVDVAGRIVRYEKDASPTHDLRYVEAGVLAFRKSVLNYLTSSGAISLEKEVFPKLIRERRFAAHITQQRFYDIGTPERLRIIEGLFKT
jgi:NDP-sugar pyrophosphorylase family protein